MLEYRNGGIQIVLGADKVAIVKVLAVEEERGGQFGDEGVEG